MANPTTNFGWVMPTSTDLVTDLPADFNVFGQGVDTTMADLKGGTTGQILSKATNTDMDFVWIANDQGDITGVTATSPLTGGGTSGAITVGIQDATTSVKGAVQLSDSTSTTSSVLASTPTATKSAYDLANTANTAAGTAQTTANAAIPKSTVTTAGDVIYATGSSAVTRLGIGSTGQVLTVAAGVPSWAAASSGALKLISATNFTSSSAVNLDNVFSTTYQYYKIIINVTSVSVATSIFQRMRVGGADTTTGYLSRFMNQNSTTIVGQNQTQGFYLGETNSTGVTWFSHSQEILNAFESRPTQMIGAGTESDGGTLKQTKTGGVLDNSTSYTGTTFYTISGNMTGTVRVYAYANS